MTTATLQPPGDGGRPTGPPTAEPTGTPPEPATGDEVTGKSDTVPSLLPRTVLIAGAAVVGLAALVAIASNGTPVWSTPREGRADRGDLLVTVGLLVGAGIAATLIITVALHRLVLANRPNPPRLRSTMARALPIAVIVLAVLALIAIARTDLDPEPPDAGPPPETPTEGSAEIGDFDHDGRPDIGIDHDGDGTIDHVAPLDERGNTMEFNDGAGVIHFNARFGDEQLGALDFDSDGTIDQYVEFDTDGDGAIDIDPSSGYDESVLYDLLDIRSPDDDPGDPTDLDDENLDPDNENLDPDEEDERPDEPQERNDPADNEDDGGPDLSVLGPILLILLAVVAAAVLGAAFWSWYSRRGPQQNTDGPSDAADQDEPDHATRQAMAGTVASSIDSMLADPDPRTAIIGAYARLLEGLAACNVGRFDHEAPMEHLRRALTGLRVRPEPLHRLIELFELARFSSHPLTEAHRTEALDALRAAAGDLADTAARQPDAAAAQPTGAPR